jgi:DNA-binding MarR family transcriptional regulator
MSSFATTRATLLAALDRNIRQASAQGVLFSEAVALRLGINSTDLECLDIIALRGPITAGDLARVTGLTTGAITGTVDRLERAGFAQRRRDANDRRKVFVEPLPAIERRIVPLFSSLKEAMGEQLAVYSDEELTFLIEFFTRTHRTMMAETAKLRAGARSSRNKAAKTPTHTSTKKAK